MLKNNNKPSHRIISRCIILIIILIFFSNFVSAKTIIRRGASWDETCTDGTCNRVLYSSQMNYLLNGSYVPINTTITSSSDSKYDYEMTKGLYKAFFEDNINTGEAVKFVKDNYYFIYDLSGGKMQFAVENKTGTPDWGKTKSIGSISSSTANINNNKISYDNSFTNTNIEYYMYNEMLKENFILNNLPVGAGDYVYLEYTGEIKFSDELSIWANGVQQNKTKGFNTTGRIELKDSNGTTIFFLPVPTATDANNNITTLRYDVKPGTTKFAFHLQTPIKWLSNATYPVIIDPTVKLPSQTAILDDATVDRANPTTSYGSGDYTSVSLKQQVGSPLNYNCTGSGSPPGTCYRSYTKYNISMADLSGTEHIDNATAYFLCTTGTATHRVYTVINDAWSEDTLTWDNQPCGTDIDNTSGCNLTFHDNVSLSGCNYNTFGSVWFSNFNQTSGNFSFMIAERGWTSTTTDNIYSKEETQYISGHLNMTYTTTEPDISLVAPSDNNWTNDLTPIFTYNVTDANDNVTNCTLWINSTAFGENQSTVNNTNTYITANHSITEDVSYVWWVNCTDASANEVKSSNRTISIDASNPNVTIISPVDGNYTDDTTPSITFNFTDMLSNISSCTLYINGSNVACNTSVVNGTSTTLTSNASLLDGSHYYNVSCIDQAGNTNTSTARYIIVDDSAPIISIIRPGGGNWTNNDQPNFFFLVKDIVNSTMNCELIISSVTYGMNNSVINNTLSNITANVSLSDATNYSWYVSCEDNINTQNSTARQIHIDTTAPSAVKAPTLNLTTAYFNHSFTCNFTIKDSISAFKLVNFSWYVNSTYQKYNNVSIPLINNTEYQSIVFSGNYSRNDNVSCNLTVWDNANNILTSGDTITISNLASIAANASIFPSPADSSSTLNCTYDYWDPDGDPHNNSYFNWSINGAQINVFTQNLSAGNTSVGDVVNCSVMVSDGMLNSTRDYSPNVDLADSTPPILNGTMLSASSGTVATTIYIYASCTDADSGLMINYPKVSFDDPSGNTQGNFTMSLYLGTQYRYAYIFTNDGTYENFSFYCRDAQNNLALNQSTGITFIASNVSGTVGGGGGGGERPTRTIIVENITLEAFCGDGTCDSDENPFSCSQDCKVNFETAITCIFTDFKSCFYTNTWFVTVLVLLFLASFVFIFYKSEEKKEPPWLKKVKRWKWR